MIVDLSEVPHEIRTKMDEILTGKYSKDLQAAVDRQKRIAQEFHNNKPRSIDGIGGQDMALDPFIDAHCKLARGGNVWEDSDYKKWFLKKNPESRVKSGGTKMQVGYQRPDPKFSKSYG